MAMPWHIPLEAAPCFKEKVEQIQPSLLKHYCKIPFHDHPCEELQTGLMCEIGMNNRDPSTIQRLIAAGMTVARLNLRDMEPEACSQLVQSVRQAVYNYSAELEYVYPLAVVVDVRGPDVVTGDLKGGSLATVEIVKDETIRLTTDSTWKESGNADCLYVNYEHLTELQTGDFIFIDCVSPGKIKLMIEDVGDDSMECRVLDGGTIGPKMSVHIARVPREKVSAEGADGDTDESRSCDTSCSHEETFQKMQSQITWAISSDVDGVMIPNTQHVNDIWQVRLLLNEKGKHILVIACIDTALGFDKLDDIIAEADAIHIDRSVLSFDVPIEKICIAQKIITAKCNDAGKPCIFRAVINEQVPTLCVTDLANLVIDGVDVICLELHYDSPLKRIMKDGVKMAEHCLAAAGVIARHAERVVWQPRVYGNLEFMQTTLDKPTEALCVSAMELAMRSRAVVIICLTNSGRTAKILSHTRPPCPIVAVTRACHTARQLRFWRGVRAVHYFEVARETWPLEVESRIRSGLDYCKAKRLVRAGDAYVVVTGTRRGGGYCDSIRLMYASVRDPIVTSD